MWEASDETGHFAFVKYLASQREFPRLGQAVTEWFDESHQPPLYYLLAAIAVSWIDTDDGLEPEMNPYVFSGKDIGGVNITIHSDREAFPYRGTALAMHVARLVSVAISTAVVALTYLIGCLLFPRDEAIAVGATALTAFWPQFLFLGAVVTNDILVPLFSSLVILFLLRIEYQRSNWAGFLGLGVCLVGAVATKMSAWGLIPLSALVLMLIGMRRVPVQVRWLVWPAVSLCLGGAWWWLRGLALPRDLFETIRYGDVMWTAIAFVQHPIGQATGLPWDILPGALEYCSRTIWASFGWDNVGVEEWVYQIFILLCLFGAIGLVKYMLRESRGSSRFGVVVLLLGVAFVFIPAILTVLAGEGQFLYGRIVAGAIPLLSLLLFLGLSRLLPQRYTKLLAIAVGAGLCVLALIIPFRYIIPAYARPVFLSAGEVEDIEHPLRVNFEHKVELLGYDLNSRVAKVGEAISLTL